MTCFDMIGSLFLKKRKDNGAGLSRTALKYIAVIAMTLNHAVCFFEKDSLAAFFLLFIGRLTLPVMAFFISEGYRLTSNLSRYYTRILLFAFISQVPYSLLAHGTFLYYELNIFFTLFLCLAAIDFRERARNNRKYFILVAVLILMSIPCDWALTAPSAALLFNEFSKNRKKLLFSYCSLTALTFLFELFSSCVGGEDILFPFTILGMLLFIPAYLTYNGERGRGGKISKWFFYVYYPLHLTAIYVIYGFCAK